jgi:putative membrane-bound dehydrogenase-like protein
MNLSLLLLVLSADITPPQIVDDRLQLQLVAAEPDVVTPTGLAVDDRGRVLVIESHTHFPPDGYKGPKHDRILLMDDFDPATGKARKISVFFEGTTHTMNLAVYYDGSIYVATRSEVFRLRDTDNDGQAEERTRICHLETAGNYPHNGLSGFAFDFAGNVYFGFGENLGADYKLIGSDGKSLSGGGEGGNIYCCDPAGKNLRRVATGFWNPFNLCFDAFGRLFAVDNDPDSRPPCRLLHIVEGGDYGYRFRNGRKGVHPFTAWNGELPGTLPMVAGTGEAPCAVLAYESDNLPEDYRGDLLVTSWGDHRLERYRLKPRGASFSAEMTPVLRGDQNFRPVGLALAPDGSLYFSDWVDKSYNVHGKGRVWRLSAKKPPKPNRPENPIAALSSPHGPWREAGARKLTREQALTVAVDSASERVRSLAGRAYVLKSGPILAYAKHLESDPIASKRGGDKKFMVAHLRAMEATARIRPEQVQKISDLMEKRYRNLLKLEQPGESEVFHRLWLNWLDTRDSASVGVSAEWLAGTTSALQTMAPGIERHRIAMDSDPFLATAVIDVNSTVYSNAPVAHLEQAINDALATQSPAATLMAIVAYRSGLPLRNAVPALLGSDDPDLQIIGVMITGDHRLVEHRELIEKYLAGCTGRRQFEIALAALILIDGDRPTSAKDESPGETYIATILENPISSSAVKRFALRSLRPDHPALNNDLLKSLLADEDASIRLESIRTIRQRADADRWPQLREIAADSQRATQERCEAILGLSPGNKDDRKLLFDLAAGENMEVADEAIRALRGFDLSEGEKRTLTDVAAKLDEPRKELAQRVLDRNPPKDQPKPDDQVAWLKLAEGEGNAQAGERIFYHARVAGCFRCHEFEGRGYQVGPDLTNIGRTMTRERLVQSITDPSREIAPMFTNWSILTTGGEVKTGVHIGDEVDGRMKYADQNGRVFHVHPNDIDRRQPSNQSVMPTGLAENLTAQELRDLLAFLVGQASRLPAKLE